MHVASVFLKPRVESQIGRLFDEALETETATLAWIASAFDICIQKGTDIAQNFKASDYQLAL